MAGGARFCAQCGAPVDLAADGGAAVPPGPPPEELRQISVVFCDLVGSTQLSARLGPEEFGELIRSYQERVGEVLDQHGGAVDKYLGDGILVHFGLPRAHDDDAERAVVAALAIADELASGERGEPLSVRLGIHTGPVLVGEMGSRTRREPMALGETMNIAARLQGSAPPGGVVISEATLGLVRGIFVVEDLGPQRLAGVADPVAAFRVRQRTGVRSKLDAAGDRLTPLVNRARELGWIREQWRCAGRGDGRTLLLVGEPGIGKSRLVFELRRELRDQAHSWLEARGSSYTENTAFQPAIALVEQALELAPDDDDDARLEKLEAGLEQAGVTEPDALGVLAELLAIESPGLPQLVMGPALAHRRRIELLAKWVLGLARLQPMLLLVEDLHWCDGSTLQLFEQLLVQGKDHPLLLVGTTRPELEADWTEHPHLHRLELAPLGEPEIHELLSGLGPAPLPDAVLRRVADEVDGIPLFAEEVGRTVLESGALAPEGGPAAGASLEQLEIPATLQDSLMARLDRLSAAKRVAQLAAVVGREFDYRLLAEACGLEPDQLDHGLARLVEAELLFCDGEPPDARYTFKHALIQDAAYASLPRRSRRPIHERTAAALEVRGASPELLARHWEGAGRTREAVAEYGRAAEEAARHSAHREAIAHLRKAIALSAGLSDDGERKSTEVDLQTALGSSIMASRGYADDEIEVAYDRARALCADLGHGSRVGYTLVGLAIYYFNSGRVAEGAGLASEALEVAEAESDDTLALLARVQLAVPRLWQGRFAEALENAEEACALYDRDRHHDLAFRFGTDQGVSAICMAGCALASTGRPDQGLARVREAVALARELGNPFNTTYALAIECGVRWIRGELAEQEALAEEVVALAEEHGFTDFQGMGRILRGTAHSSRTGDPAGLEDCLAGLELAAGTGRRGSVTMFLELIAAAHAAQGRLKEALTWIENGVSLARETGQHWWDPKLLWRRAELRLELGNDDAQELAEADLRRAGELARASADTISELRCATTLARLLVDRGERSAPEALLAPVLERLTEGLGTRVVEEARALLGERPAQPTSVLKPSSG